MSFTDIFIRRPVLASVVSLLILLIGLAAGFNLPVRQFPRITNTTITITTAYPGANADLIKGFITTPIQQAVASAEGIDTLTSSSQQNYSIVTLNLRLDANPDRAVADVLSKIQQVKSVLPRESQDPIVVKQTGETTALMYLSFNSKVLTGSQITDYLTRVVQPRLQTINGVAKSADASSVFDGLKAVFLGIFAAPTSNPLTVIGDVRKAFPEIQRQLPTSMEAAIAYDATKFINASIAEVQITLLEAALIVIV